MPNEATATLENAPKVEAKKIPPPSKRLMWHIASGKFAPESFIGESGPVQKSDAAAKALNAQFDAMRQKNDEHRGTQNLFSRHEKMIDWTGKALGTLGQIEENLPEEVEEVYESALIKLKLYDPQNPQQHFADNFYKLTGEDSGQEGVFYKEFCTGNVPEKIANALSVEEMEALKSFLVKDVLGSEEAFEALKVLKHTQNTDLQSLHPGTFGDSDKQFKDGEKAVLGFFAQGHRLAGENHPAMQPQQPTSPEPSQSADLPRDTKDIPQWPQVDYQHLAQQTPVTEFVSPSGELHNLRSVIPTTTPPNIAHEVNDVIYNNLVLRHPPVTSPDVDFDANAKAIVEHQESVNAENAKRDPSKQITLGPKDLPGTKFYIEPASAFPFHYLKPTQEWADSSEVTRAYITINPQHARHMQANFTELVYRLSDNGIDFEAKASSPKRVGERQENMVFYFSQSQKQQAEQIIKGYLQEHPQLAQGHVPTALPDSQDGLSWAKEPNTQQRQLTREVTGTNDRNPSYNEFVAAMVTPLYLKRVEQMYRDAGKIDDADILQQEIARIETVIKPYTPTPEADQKEPVKKIEGIDDIFGEIGAGVEEQGNKKDREYAQRIQAVRQGKEIVRGDLQNPNSLYGTYARRVMMDFYPEYNALSPDWIDPKFINPNVLSQSPSPLEKMKAIFEKVRNGIENQDPPKGMPSVTFPFSPEVFNTLFIDSTDAPIRVEDVRDAQGKKIGTRLNRRLNAKEIAKLDALAGSEGKMWRTGALGNLIYVDYGLNPSRKFQDKLDALPQEANPSKVEATIPQPGQISEERTNTLLQSLGIPFTVDQLIKQPLSHKEKRGEEMYKNIFDGPMPQLIRLYGKQLGSTFTSDSVDDVIRLMGIGHWHGDTPRQEKTDVIYQLAHNLQFIQAHPEVRDKLTSITNQARAINISVQPLLSLGKQNVEVDWSESSQRSPGKELLAAINISLLEPLEKVTMELDSLRLSPELVTALKKRVNPSMVDAFLDRNKQPTPSGS